MENSKQPAFPLGHSENLNYNSDINDTGLTKREYFAGLAMQGLMVQAIAGIHNSNSEIWNTERAKFAVAMADALLKELDNIK